MPIALDGAESQYEPEFVESEHDFVVVSAASSDYFPNVSERAPYSCSVPAA